MKTTKRTTTVKAKAKPEARIAAPAAATPATPAAAAIPALPVAAVTVKPAPTRDDIARRAHEIYVARGKAPGNEVADWVQAERELAQASHQNN